MLCKNALKDDDVVIREHVFKFTNLKDITWFICRFVATTISVLGSLTKINVVVNHIYSFRGKIVVYFTAIRIYGRSIGPLPRQTEISTIKCIGFPQWNIRDKISVSYSKGCNTGKMNKSAFLRNGNESNDCTTVNVF